MFDKKDFNDDVSLIPFHASYGLTGVDDIYWAHWSKQEGKVLELIQSSTTPNRGHLIEKWQENITHKIAKRLALSKQVTTELQSTDKKARQTRNINNKNDPQKKHRLGTVSKKYFYWRA